VGAALTTRGGQNVHPAEEIDKGGQRELGELVLRSGLCSGCGACVDLCPYQVTHRDRTVMLHACDRTDGRCFSFCPSGPTDLDELRSRLCAPADLTCELGAVKGFYIARATDPGVREGSQHGGAVTALMTLALREGLIDAAVLTDKGDGLLPEVVTVEDPEAVGRVGGSRFVVAPVVAEFNRAVRAGYRRIGVVATPCQALALAKMRCYQPARGAGLPAEAGDQPPATGGGDRLRLVVGLFCGWALSWREFRSVLRRHVDLSEITGMDIPPSRYHTLEVYTRTGTVSLSLDEVEPCIRESCHSCSDMTAEFSDISVGSARLPEGWETGRSWNQLIVRTDRGQELLDLARARGVLEFKDVPEENLPKLKTASVNKQKNADPPERPDATG